ncbi:MAG TPA: biopolymer transporter ExbD [Paludibacteraceae bacterium]|jgi:biopolymer transport protein ExbD|nr:biopolymer transporter ExbD [Paludibacteraceae bacterium]HQB68884.1 biopolymer transporter ExbD [Paludibacteraceae bacterium]HRS67150.1 biopolymer transporter ExbD [Paludibacteraceae bacterium]
MEKKKVQEINASSMADISFLLLIFFLVTTTMSVDKGLSRRLPPPLPPNMEKADIDVKKRNIFIVLINSNNQLLVQGEALDVKELREKAKTFIKNEADDASLPEKLPVEVEFDGIKEQVLTTKNHVISLQNDRGTQYQKYIEVQNELVAAYNELRNEMSLLRFGMKYDELDENRQKAIQTVYPQKISEAEPKNYGGKK